MIFNSIVSWIMFLGIKRKVGITELLTPPPPRFSETKGLVGTGGRVDNSVDPAALHGSYNQIS
jgi:hypothetical protein